MRVSARRLGALLVPPRCAICARPCAGAELVCRPCAAALRGAGAGSAELPGLGPLTWAATYDGVARRLVTALKFGRRVALAELAAEALAAELAGAIQPPLTIVPVPPAARRHRARGFDPAALIAAALARRLGQRAESLLVRLDSRRQVGRPREQRIARPPAIRARRPAPAAALVVDDVATTGATLRACAGALRVAGARRVAAAVFARSL